MSTTTTRIAKKHYKGLSDEARANFHRAGGLARTKSMTAKQRRELGRKGGSAPKKKRRKRKAA